QLKWCDYTGIVGNWLTNPIKVKAFNKITRQGEPNFNINFSVKDAITTDYDFDPENTQTLPPHGIAETKFKTGMSYVQYNVRAFCDNCLTDKEVFCSILAKQPKDIEKERTKVKPDSNLKVRFEPASFQVVYGKSINLCAIVDPPEKTSILSFESAKSGFFVTINVSPHTGCTSAGDVSLKIESRTNVCILQDSVRVLLDDAHPVAEAPGTVLIPTSEYAIKKIEDSSNCNAVSPALQPLCKYDAYNIYFSPSDSRFENLIATERLFNVRDFKNLPDCERKPPPRYAGHLEFDVNENKVGLTDSLGIGSLIEIPKNCGYQFDQIVYIEACPIQTNSVSVEFNSTGNIKTIRSDGE
ncbi:hypothetical protein KKG71_03870, partial [Patescibacteria group bacterium]|nr:hypothetical protein [Patescibacteria group bacterium]